MPRPPAADVVRLWWLADPGQVVCRVAYLLVALTIVAAAVALGRPGAATVSLAILGLGAADVVKRFRAIEACFTGSVADDPITTPRLVLRAARSEDADHLAATVDDEVRRANGWTRRTEREVLRSVRRGMAGDLGVLVITDRQGAVVGEAQARRSPDGTQAEIGWWIGPGHRERGYAGEPSVRCWLGSTIVGPRRSCSGRPPKTSPSNGSPRSSAPWSCRPGASASPTARSRTPSGSPTSSTFPSRERDNGTCG